MKLVILGPQGSGKGTQADLLSRHFKIPHIDVGQLLREHVAQKTEFGKKIEGPMKRGELLPHDVVDLIVEARLENPDCKKGFVIDGYPRQLEEAEFLDSITKLDAVILLDIPDELAVERISRRRVCVGCDVPLYGLPEDIGKKCIACGGALKQREDDKPEAVRKRLEVYHEETEPLIDYYKPRDIVRKIDGRGEVRDVFKLILKEME
jgi:adenylate kinase